MSQRPERDIYTVGRLNREVRLLLESGLPAIWVEAEISNFSAPASGHWYFTLKDREAQIRCAMFRSRNLAVGFRPREGQLLLARGRVGLYEARGDYQLVVESLEDAGEGALKREFERLKQRLAAEGLFETARKRSLPGLPRRIAVVTSATGAAIRDILHILARRYAPAAVRIYPVAVQGAAAPAAIAAALDTVSAHGDCDVVILARGGGSLEDLWAFNDEAVARAIFRSAVPVVTGIGHETDFTIADFVADVRAPTPSGAAQLVVPDRLALQQQLQGQLGRLRLSIQRQLSHGMQRHEAAWRRLQQAHPGARLAQQAQRIDDLEARLRSRLAERLATPLRQTETLRLRLHHAWQAAASRATQRLELAARGLDAVSPLATLQRGFAIVTGPVGTVLTDAAGLKAGDTVNARLANGQFTAVVREVRS